MEEKLNQTAESEFPELSRELVTGSNTLISILINGRRWSTQNFNQLIDGSYSYNDDPYFGHVFGRVYPFETLISSLPNEAKIPSVEDWESLIRSVKNNVFDLSIRGFSGLELKPVGFHISSKPVISNYSVFYWTSTTNGNNQIAVHFDFLHNKFDFDTISRNWAVAARLIIN